jgi:hypothetical protein
MSAPTVEMKLANVVLKFSEEISIAYGTHRIAIAAQRNGTMAITVTSVGTGVSLPMNGPFDAVVGGA